MEMKMKRQRGDAMWGRTTYQTIRRCPAAADGCFFPSHVPYILREAPP